MANAINSDEKWCTAQDRNANQRKYWKILINIDLYSGGELTKRVHTMKDSGVAPAAIALELGVPRGVVRYRLTKQEPQAGAAVVFELILPGS